MKLSVLEEKFHKELKKRNEPILNMQTFGKKFDILNEMYRKEKLLANKAYGCFIEDCQGNIYIDTALGAGTHILGHASPVIVEQIEKQIRDGIHYIMPNRNTYIVGDILSSIVPHFQGFVFCNSGTEATMRAVRIARAYSGKTKVAMFGGGWHGGNDMLLFEEDYNSNEDNPLYMFKSAGIPEELQNMILMLPYNSEAAFEVIERYKNELAMVIIEPSQGSNPRDDVGDFLHKLRQITIKYNILLCFDEIITGFRIALGGCQEYYGQQPDLATYGKTMGGGLPTGVIAGKKEVMQVIKGNSKRKPVFMGGTFSANQLVMSVSNALLQHLIENRETIYPYLNDNGQYVRNTVNKFCIARQIPVRMIGIGSMSRLIFTDKFIRSRRERDKHEVDVRLQNLFYQYLLLEKGIYVNSNRTLFISTAHKDKHIKKISQSIIESLENFAEHFKIF